MIEKIKKIIGNENVVEHVSLKDICTFKIGGTARALLEPSSFGELFEIVELLDKNNFKYKVIGNASNILFGDGFVDAFIISTKNLLGYEFQGETDLVVSAGVNLSSIMWACCNKGLGGLEFAAGIPGSLGGAIKMNAGANGADISKVLKSVTFYENGFIKTKCKDELNFVYRSSYFARHTNAIILFAELELVKREKEKVYNEIITFLKKRNQTQPKEFSAGCVFKRTALAPAGELIDNLGLKGKRVGGAKISPVHANFIVNMGEATCSDVKTLINEIQVEIYKNYNTKLELEIEIFE